MWYRIYIIKSIEKYEPILSKAITSIKPSTIITCFLSLEESFETFKEGMELVKKCNAGIDKVEKEA